MSNNLKKFVCPKFTRTIDPDLMARLFERHRAPARRLRPAGAARRCQRRPRRARGVLRRTGGALSRRPRRRSAPDRRAWHRAGAPSPAGSGRAAGDRDRSRTICQCVRPAPRREACRASRLPGPPQGVRRGVRHAGADSAVLPRGIRRNSRRVSRRILAMERGPRSRPARRRCSRRTTAGAAATATGALRWNSGA